MTVRMTVGKIEIVYVPSPEEGTVGLCANHLPTGEKASKEIIVVYICY